MRFVGVPWISGGRDLANGCDCWGIVLAAARELYGFEFPDYRAYSDANNLAQVMPLFDERRRGWHQIPRGGEREGDVIVLLMAGAGAHAGLVVGNGIMLHSLPGIDACVERYSCVHWRNRIEGFYRWQRLH